MNQLGRAAATTPGTGMQGLVRAKGGQTQITANPWFAPGAFVIAA